MTMTVPRIERPTHEALSAMTDDGLRTHINERLSGDQVELWSLLLTATHARRTLKALKAISRTLNKHREERHAQVLAAKVAYNDGEISRSELTRIKADYTAWQARQASYRRLVDRRTAQATDAVRDAHKIEQEQRDMASRRVARILTLAIHRHQQASLAADITPEPHDLALWAVLTGTTLDFGAQQIPLAQAIAEGRWTEATPTPGDNS